MLGNDLKHYSSSFMSNSKWRKFFAVINNGSIPLSVCVWKLVTHKEPKNGFLPVQIQLGDDYVGDCGALNGPFSFREIEWLFLPSSIGFRPYEHAPIRHEYQDIDHIKNIIDGAGKFEYETSDDGLRIFGYKP